MTTDLNILRALARETEARYHQTRKEAQEAYRAARRLREAEEQQQIGEAS